MATVATFGEIMMRLATPLFQRFAQARDLEVTYGGGEANVAVSLANYGVNARFVTALPKNDIGQACENYLRQYGVDTSYIARQGDRLGIYFLENGAAQRGSKVVYDRAGSAIAEIKAGDIDWDKAFEGVDWFHWTGITPAISQRAADVCLEAIKAARGKGITVSADLNYRKNLWKYGKKASEVMPELVGLCDVAIGNEEDAEKVFGISAAGADVESGKVEAEGYRAVAEALISKFPSLNTVSITLRGSLSASRNTWSGILYQNGEMFVGPLYDITHIVDRVGGGDSFCGGLIFATLDGRAPQECIDFAVAASCLKHSIHGDFNMATISEVEALIKGGGSGRVQR